MYNPSGYFRVEKLLPLLVVVGLVVAACGPISTPEVSPTQEPVKTASLAVGPEKVFKLGIMGPFTGPATRTGDEFKAAASMALEAINWQIGSYKIEPVWIDSQSDPGRAVEAYKGAVQEGIQAAALNWHSSVAVACMEVAASHRIPHIFAFGATEVVNETFASDPEKYGYWMNKGWPTAEKLSISYVQLLEDAIAAGTWAPTDKSVAFYVEDTHWGHSFRDALKSQLEEAGWTTVSEEHFDLNQSDFYGSLNGLMELAPAVIALTTTALPTYAALIKQADEVGLKSLIIADGLGWFGEWYELVGDSSNCVLDQIPGWATEDGKAFAETFEARWGFPPSPSAAGLAYDGTNMFIQVAQHALDKYGELSSQAIYDWARENLQTGEWSYTDGIVMEEYKYTLETTPDPVVGKGYYIFPVLQYFGGEGKIVYPPEWAEQGLSPKP